MRAPLAGVIGMNKPVASISTIMLLVVAAMLLVAAGLELDATLKQATTPRNGTTKNVVLACVAVACVFSFIVIAANRDAIARGWAFGKRRVPAMAALGTVYVWNLAIVWALVGAILSRANHNQDHVRYATLWAPIALVYVCSFLYAFLRPKTEGIRFFLFQTFMFTAAALALAGMVVQIARGNNMTSGILWCLSLVAYALFVGASTQHLGRRHADAAPLNMVDVAPGKAPPSDDDFSVDI